MDLSFTLLPKFCGLCFTCESWDTKLEEKVESLPCKSSLGAIVCWFLLCGPFVARGDKEGEEYP
jgi:hypothetical protein